MKVMKILWVDDEIDLLKPFILFLEERNYDVDTCNNGTDAIEKVVETKYDLVILDEMMPGLDGLSTLQEIKRINNAIPIIMVTKSEEEGLMNKAIASQISDYLIKPINPSQIIMAIKKIFQADEIRANEIGQQYSQYMAKLNQRLFANPDWNEWGQIYLEMAEWELRIDAVNDENLRQTHFLEKRNCNTEFTSYIERNYRDWLKTDERPNLSFDLVSQYVAPHFEEKVPIYFIIIDCMRLDQYLSIEPYIQELFDVEMDMYFSILPTATPYSRNAIFSGLLPIDIAKRFPEYWVTSNEMDNSRNRNEHQLLDEHIVDLGYNLDPSSKYVKIFNMEEGNFVLRKIETWTKDNLIVLVYNFLDLLAHHRSRDQILQETIPHEEGLRAFTKHWFLHSALYEALKLIAKQDAIVIISTDHGSIKVNRATQVIGDRDTSITVRYKEGKNLTANDRHALFVKKPSDFGLPSKSIVDNFIFAKDDYYFVYPNSYHQYQRQYNGTFQHGGVSMEEMILPIVTCRSKKKDKKGKMYLSDLLNAKAILHIAEALSKEQVYQMLVDKICKHHGLPICGDALLRLIHQRDQVSSTAYPTGISIPHIRMEGFDDTVVSMAFLDSPLDYEGTPVNWVCLVISDKSSSRLYLNLVSGLLKLSQNTGLMKSMLETDGPGVVHLIQDLKIQVTKEITVADVMEANPICVRPSALLRELGDIICTNSLPIIPVTDEAGNYLGEANVLRLLKVGVPDYLMMLDDVSFLRSYEPLEKLFEQEDILTVQEIIDSNEARLSPETSIPEAVFEMIHQQKDFYPVVDAQGKLVGMVTAMDILKKVIKA